MSKDQPVFPQILEHDKKMKKDKSLPILVSALAATLILGTIVFLWLI